MRFSDSDFSDVTAEERFDDCGSKGCCTQGTGKPNVVSRQEEEESSILEKVHGHP